MKDKTMEYIRFMVEYKAWPLWRYNKGGRVIDNCTPSEWDDDIELNVALKALSDYYDSLFLDDDGNEDFHKDLFDSEEKLVTFKSLLNRAKELVKNKNNGKYKIVFDD